MITDELFLAFKSKIRSLVNIPDDEWIHVESLLTPQNFKKGEHIIRAGEKTDSMYIILKGLTRSYFIDQDGKEFNKIFLAENDIASAYVELLNNIPSRLNIEALEDTSCMVTKFKDIQALYQRHPCWNQLGRIIAENFFVLKEKREYEFLLLDAEKRYQNFLAEYSHILGRIPQYQIAAYLGITPVSLSRIINKYQSN
jgi:CRP-like cAMP-binding protein